MISKFAARGVFGGLIVAMVVCAWTAGRAADDRGEHLYDQNCRRCHGTEGRGTTQAPSLVPFDWTYDEALALIRHPVCDMPPIPESVLSDAQVAQIVAYLKSIK